MKTANMDHAMKHHLKCLILALTLFPLLTHAAFHNLPARYTLSFEDVALPNNQSMGLAGFQYTLDINDGFYAGPGGFGAVTGHRGGLFVLGVDGGYQHVLFGPILADINFFAGGGGAHNNNNDEGGGLMLRPSARLLYDCHGYQLGLGYSYITYPEGKIRSHNWLATISIPSTFHFYDSEKPMQGDMIQFDESTTLRAHHSTISLRNQTYFDGDHTIQLVGVELSNYFSPHFFGYMQTAGAYDGMQNGYMEIVGGAGVRFFENTQWSLLAKLGGGAAGGGDANTGGGFIVKPEVTARYHVTPGLSFDLSTGYFNALDGRFNGGIITAALTHSFDVLTPDVDATTKFAEAKLQKWVIGLNNVTYFDPERTNNVNQNVQLISLNLHYFLTNTFYMIGEGASAYTGNAGSFATGMCGLGLQSPTFFKQLSVHAAMLAGAAGGGGIDVHHGLVWQPRAGLAIDLTKHIATVIDYSHVAAIHGSLNANVMTVGLQYGFAELRKY